jgi:hypothetical protein
MHHLFFLLDVKWTAADYRKHMVLFEVGFRRVYPKVSRLAAWSENCKWYSSLPLGTVVSLFCESV